MTTRREAIDVSGVWGAPLTAIHCAHCGEGHLVPEGETPSQCPFCLQGPVTPQPAYLRGEPPEQVLPPQVSRDRLTQVLEHWSRGIWFRPGDLKPSLLVQRARRYLIPLWLVDGQMEATWRADVGFDYQVVSHRDQYQDGAGWRSQEVQETRVRWEPRVGRLHRIYQNVAAPALDDHRALMGKLGHFDIQQRANYTPQVASGAAVRIPSLDPEAAWPGIERAFERTAEGECQQAAGADHVRNFAVQAKYQNLNWTLLLLPAFVTWYREGERVWPVLINGQTGRVSGVRRASTGKAITWSLVLGAVALLLFLLGGVLTLVFPLFVVLPVLAVLLGLAAPAPAIAAWVFNRREKGK